MGRKRKYSDEFRLKVVKEYLSGEYGGSVAYRTKSVDKNRCND